MRKKKKAVILSSGGLDSTTAMAMVKKEGFEIYSLSFDYGQRHRFELKAAARVAQALKASSHLVIKLDLRKIGGSALTDRIDVPKSRKISDMQGEIPVTYVPARNTIFLSYALAWAEVSGVSDIVIGVNAVDYSGYPDCRPEYIEAFERLANLATKTAVEKRVQIKIRAPLLYLSKAQIIKKGVALGVDYSITHSCYDPFPGGIACGQCDSCILRLKGFAAAGHQDPVRYRKRA
jgi:7-cyano-7-deazaguanine synthase